MSDIDRLQAWLREHDLTFPQIAHELGIKYNTLWVMVERRGEVSDRFIVHFIRRYGCEEAMAVFPDRLGPFVR